MSKNQEFAEEVLRRIKQLEQQDVARSTLWKRRLHMAVAAVCLALIVALSFILPTATETIAVITPNASGTMLIADASVGGYVLMGLAGFVLGAALVLLCTRQSGRG